jgi:ketosteroid isomerase-like protein
MPVVSFQLRILVFILICILAWGQEPVKPSGNPRVMTATRQVTVFGALEQQLLFAVQKKDKAALASMLAENFVVQMPDADTLAAEDWMDSVMDKGFILKSFGITNVSATDFGDVVIVKFNRAQQATFNGNNESGEFFVVDAWKKSEDTWKLANRYVVKLKTLPATERITPKPSGKQ